MTKNRRDFLKFSAASAASALFSVDAEAQVASAVIWVGTKLLEGAVAYVGGQVLAQMLGGTTIGDVNDWIRSAIGELEQFFSDKLDDQAIRRITADAQGIQQNLLEYAALSPTNQTGNRFLLEDADTRSSALIPLAQTYDQAFDVASGAMAFKICATRALFELDKDPGHILSEKDFVDRFLTLGAANYKTIDERESPHSRIKVEPGFVVSGLVLLDGHDTGLINWAEGVVKELNRRGILPEVLRKRKEFEANGIRSLNAAASAYDKLCRLVGGSYSSPVPLPQSLSPDGAVFFNGRDYDVD